MTGFVLAGGASSRMGRDKALLPVGRATLIERVMCRLRPRVQRVVVIGNPRNIAELRALPIDEVLLDLAPGYGPLMGVFTGLMHTSSAVNVFVSCDMPYIEGQVIDRLSGDCREDALMASAVHPEQGLQPFPLACHLKACGIVGALLNRGERSLRALLSHPSAGLVQIREPELWRAFANVNTLADYAQLCAELATPRSQSEASSRDERWRR